MKLSLNSVDWTECENWQVWQCLPSCDASFLCHPIILKINLHVSLNSSTWHFLSAGKVMYRLIIQATLFRENTVPAKCGLLALLLSCMIFSTYRSFQLVINQSIKKCQEESIIFKAGNLMVWTNEGRCCEITQLSFSVHGKHQEICSQILFM